MPHLTRYVNRLSLLGNIFAAYFTENYPLKYLMTSTKENIYNINLCCVIAAFVVE